MPVAGQTRPFGAGPFGFAAFGSWRLDFAGARALGDGAAGGGVLRSREGQGRAAAASATMGGALNPKVSGGALAGLSDARGAVRRDGVRGGRPLCLSDMIGGVARTLGATGQAAGQSYLRGRLRELWDRPDDIPTPPDWQPVDPGASGPWNPIAMPAPPVWVPQPPAEH